MTDLSVLIPARNEMFLRRTVEDVLEHARADTEVIVVLDGAWPEPPGLELHPRVTVLYHPESVGQRAATNQAAMISTARYVMKLDAHCSLDEGFDVKLIEAAKELGEDVTQIPAQKNLHAFDWVCSEAKHKACDFRQYQGPTPTIEVDGKHVPGCPKCSGEVEREMVWKPRGGTTTTSWRFDGDLHFQYWGDYSKRPGVVDTEFPETMSCLGACFFMSRERYWQLGGMDEQHGSWGQMGTEVGCKSWLSGGRMVCNKRTWFAHMFRTQGGDFSFPYELKGSDQDRARKYSRELWKGNRWPGQRKPLSWLIEHFAPVPGWEQAPAVQTTNVTKGVVYYSDCRGDENILAAARRQLKRAANGHSIVAVTLAPLSEHFDRNIVLSQQRGILTMFQQILAGLEASTADIVFLGEHDILYHPSHFDFVPPRKDAFYYNLNVWKVDAETGQALHYITKQTSGLCAYRELLVEHYRKRIAKVQQNARDLAAAGLPVRRDGYSRHMGFEPGCHSYPRGVDNYPALDWWSEGPNIDIRHGYNLTPSRWSKDLFRDQNSCQGWTEADEVPGWGRTRGRFSDFLQEVAWPS